MRVHFLASQVEDKKAIVRSARSRESVEWTCPKTASIGDPVFFFVRGEGVLATGAVYAMPLKSLYWDNRYASEMAEVSLLATPVPLPALARQFPDWGFPRYPRSYCTIDHILADEVIDFVVLYQASLVDDPLPTQLFPEGERNQVLFTKVERSSNARAACINRWGTTCVVCGIDFGTFYGEEFAGFIHVHHLKPFATARNERRTDPATDLRPLCPNCHAVAHLRRKPYTIRELRAFIRRTADSSE